MTDPAFSSPAATSAASAQHTRAAIARGAQATGTDFTYLLAQAKLESNLDPAARARTSSASGLFQFIEGTWLATLDKHGAAHGLHWAAAQIENSGGRRFVRDPLVREQIMALRHDPAAASVMAGALAQDNRAELVPVLGREPDSAELYLAHFLGAGGAARFLRALGSNPGMAAASLLPEAAAANRPIFFARGAPRSLRDIMDLLRDKLARAGAEQPASADSQTQYWAAQQGWRIAGGAGSAARLLPSSPAAPAPQPLSQTLAASFGLAARDGAAAPAHVRAAYGKLRAFAL